MNQPTVTLGAVRVIAGISNWPVLVNGAVADDNFYIEHTVEDGRYCVNAEVLPGAFDVREWSTLGDALEGFRAAISRGHRAFTRATGSPIVGTLESIDARCGIAPTSFRHGADGTLTFERDGSGAEVYWDSMHQQETDDGPVYLDADGEQVAEQDIELRPAFPAAG